MTDATLTCEHCGCDVEFGRAQFRIDPHTNAIAWNHVAHTSGACVMYSPLQMPRSARLSASVDFAKRLNRDGDPHTIRRIEVGDFSAYYLADINDVLWASASLLAPAGHIPQVHLPVDEPLMTTVMASTADGVEHHEDGSHEFVTLRLAVGDWLLVGEGPSPVLRRLSDDALMAAMSSAGVTPEELDTRIRNVPMSDLALILTSPYVGSQRSWGTNLSWGRDRDGYAHAHRDGQALCGYEGEIDAVASAEFARMRRCDACVVSLANKVP